MNLSNKFYASLLALSVGLEANAAHAATVNVSSYANGHFGGGYAQDTLHQPLVPAITVTKATAITITYISGTWCAEPGAGCSGANGTQITDGSGTWYDHRPPHRHRRSPS